MPHNKGHNQGKKSSKKGRSNKHEARDNARLPSLQRIAPSASLAESGGYYAVYKEATLRFHNWMSQEACSNFKMSAVNDYVIGVQHILDHNNSIYLTANESEDLIVTPREIMASLTLSIRLRDKVTVKLFGSQDGGDLGHQYIIDVLKYCQIALRFANRIAVAVAVIKSKDDDEKVEKAIGGRFNALTLDDDDGDDEEEDVDWDDVDCDIKKGNLPKYDGVEVQEEISIEQVLLKGDDRFQASGLLFAMNELMGIMLQKYGHLKNYMRGNTDHQSSSCMQLLMECAAAANLATESIHRAEIELALEHPHVSSSYHVLALVFCTDFAAEIIAHIDKTKLEKDPHMALQFIAEILECSFTKTAGHEQMPSIVRRFIKKSGLEPQYVIKTAAGIYVAISFETLRDAETRINYGVDNAADVNLAGMKPHRWLSQCKNIGGDCCILNTLKITQVFLGCLKDNTMPVGRPDGVWGLKFDENSSPARRIRGDLDDPFVCIVLTEIMHRCCEHKPFVDLLHGPQLLTVLDLFQRQIEGNPTKPVPMALTFGLHAMLMSILVLQGDGDLARVATYAKQSYNKFFEQLQTVSDRHKSPGNTPRFYDLIQSCGTFVGLAKPVRASNDPSRLVDPLQAEMLAFWNPLIGGEFMLYATYTYSIMVGSFTIDMRSQLRFVLHLYNGLRLRDPALDIAFLRKTDAVFKSSTSVWVEGKPEKGSCCKAFWMSRGVSCTHAARLASICAANNGICSLRGTLNLDHITMRR